MEQEETNIRLKVRHICNELKEHLPFTVISSIAAIILVGIMTVLEFTLKEDLITQGSQRLFHIFHPVHILFSATATSAMFWHYEKRLIKAVILGLTGSILACGISDVIIPFCSGFVLGRSFEFHMCIMDHPLIVLPFVTMGIFIGLIAMEKVEKTTFYSHSGHVFVSSMASLLYLISFGLVDWFNYVGSVFIIIIIAVIIPCCTSDIIFPLLFAKEGKCRE
ncbi:MAG: hypothetical protein ACE5KZ_03085 [Candidatus Scalinduaceae bacterium]